MLGRLGDVLYALGVLTAGASVALFSWMAWMEPDIQGALLVLGIGGALVSWVVGFACRYVLRGN